MIYSETDGRNFSLYIDDIPVLSHSPDCPFLSVCNDKSFVNRLLTRIPISGIRRKYISLDNVNYDHERSILRFSRGSRSVSFSVRESEGTVILSPIKPLQSFSHLRFGFKAIPNEPVFGCGGITSSPNLRGRHINIRGGSSAIGVKNLDRWTLSVNTLGAVRRSPQVCGAFILYCKPEILLFLDRRLLLLRFLAQ